MEPPPPDVTLFAPQVDAGPGAVGHATVGTAPLSLAPVDPPPPTADQQAHVRWARAVDAVRKASPRHGKSLSYARFLGFTDTSVLVAFPPDAAFHRSQVTGMSRALVETELSRALGRAVTLVEDRGPRVLEDAPRSIAEVEASARATRETEITRKVREHPAVRSVLKHLGGSIEHVQVVDPLPDARPAGASEDGQEE